MTEEGDVDGLTYNNDGSFQTSNEQLGKDWTKSVLRSFMKIVSWLKEVKLLYKSPSGSLSCVKLCVMSVIVVVTNVDNYFLFT